MSLTCPPQTSPETSMDGRAAQSGPPVPPEIATSDSPTQANCPDIASVTCPANTDCECFTLAVPASNPVVGSQAGGYATPVPTPVAYGVGAVAKTCTPSIGGRASQDARPPSFL